MEGFTVFYATAPRRKASKVKVAPRGDETTPPPDDGKMKMVGPYLKFAEGVTNTTGITPDMTVSDMNSAQFREYSKANSFTSKAIAQGLHDWGKMGGPNPYPEITAKIQSLVLRSKDSYIPSGERFAAAVQLANYLQGFQTLQQTVKAVTGITDTFAATVGGISAAGSSMKQADKGQPPALERFKINDAAETASQKVYRQIGATIGLDAAAMKRLEVDPAFLRQSFTRMREIQKAQKAAQEAAQKAAQQQHAAEIGTATMQWGAAVTQQQPQPMPYQNASQGFTDWASQLVRPSPNLQYNYPSRTGEAQSGGTMELPAPVGPLWFPQEEPVEQTPAPAPVAPDINQQGPGGIVFSGLPSGSNAVLLVAAGALAFLMLKGKR
jgi:hypothetical protein